MSFTESTYENAVIQLFEGMGYTHIYAPDMGREDFSDPLMDGVLRDALVRINRGLPTEAIGETMAKIRNFDGGSLIEKNRTFTEYLQNGVEVNYAVDGETRSALVRLVDFEKVENNEFAVVNQYTYIENGNNRRPDIILFVNGLPLVLMELKSPAKEDAGVEDAYNQLRNYMQDIPSMFIYNAICVISDLSANRAGTITSGLDRFMDWKTKDGRYENTAYAQFNTFYEGMFPKERLLDILKISSAFQAMHRSRSRFQQVITNISLCAKPWKKRLSQRAPTAKAAFSGTRRGAENRFQWCFMLICCKKCCTARPLLL